MANAGNEKREFSTTDAQPVIMYGKRSSDAKEAYPLLANDQGILNTGGQTLSTANTKTVTASDAQPASPWQGTWELTRSKGIVRILTIIAATDETVDGLGGTFIFEFSEDGITNNGISESRVITDFQTVRDFDLINAGAYYRCSFEPSRALSSDSVFITTTLRSQDDGAFVRIADQQIEKANAAMGQTFAYLKGFGLDDRSADFPFGGVDPNNSSSVTLTNTTVGTFTVSASTNTIELVSHGLSNGDDVVFSTSDTLPDPLAVDTQYFVINKTDDDFQVATSAGGSAIDITDTGTGTHTCKEPATYTGTYRKTAGMGACLPFAFGLEKLSVARLRWSPDGSTAKTGLLATSALTHKTTSGFEVYLSTLTTMIDSFVRMEVVNGSDDQTANSFEIDTWFYSGPFTGSYNNLDATLSALSTAQLVRSVVAGIKPDGTTFENVKLGDSGELQTANYGMEISRGNLSGKTNIRVEARNSSVDTTEQIIWNGGEAFSFSQTAASVRIKSGGNAADTAAGAGAREVTIVGINATGTQSTVTLATAGSSASATTSTQFIRINDFYVSQAGTYATGAAATGSNTGAISLETSSGFLQGIIQANQGRSGTAIYSVPAGKKGYLRRIRVTPEGSKNVTFRLWTRRDYDDVSAPLGPKMLRAEWVLLDAQGGFGLDFPLELRSKEDIWVSANTGTGNSAASCAFEIELIDD